MDTASLFTPAYRSSRGDTTAYRGIADAGTAMTGVAGTDFAGRRAGGTGRASAGDDIVIGFDDEDEPGPVYSWSQDLTTAGHSWSRPDPADQPPTVSNAIRGFPPAPGDPLPVYSGPFAAWNRGGTPADAGLLAPRSRQNNRAATASASAAARADAASPASAAVPADAASLASAAMISPADFDTDYSLPAIKDPVLGRPAAPAPGSAPAGGQRPPGTPRGRVGGSHSAGAHSAGARGKSRQATRARPAGQARKPPKRRRRQQPVWLAIGAATVVIVAVAAILIAGLGRPPARRPNAGQSASTTPPVSPTVTAPPGRWQYIGTRTTDPIPLTATELFPLNFISGGVAYGRTATSGSKHCRTALIGTTLQSAVRTAGCTQEIRATYLSRTVKMMATIGVFNLKSYPAASKAAQAAGPTQFVAQLPGKKGPTHHIGTGTGIEEALVKGHYLILVWAEFEKLHAPKTATQRQQLTAFMNLLIRQTANASLSYRMVDGKPMPPTP
jgi:hypothetical protein